MTNISLALRLLECGLAKFTLIGEDAGLCGFDCNGWEVELEVGDTTDYERIRYQCVQTNDGPRLLPDTSDFALSGWIKAEISKLVSGFVGSFPYYSETSQGWHVVVDGPDAVDGPAEMAILNCGPEATEIEALVAAWEAALEAQKGAQ